MPSSSAPSTSLVVIEKLFRWPSRSVNQSSTSSMPPSWICLRTLFRAAGSDVARFALSTCSAMGCSSLEKCEKPRSPSSSRRPRLRRLNRHTESNGWLPRGPAVPSSHGRRAVPLPPGRSRRPPAADRDRRVGRAARRRRLVLAPPDRPSLRRRLGGAGQPVDPRVEAARLVPRGDAADVHAARHRRHAGGRAGAPCRGRSGGAGPAPPPARRPRAARRRQGGAAAHRLRRRHLERDRHGHSPAAPARADERDRTDAGARRAGRLVELPAGVEAAAEARRGGRLPADPAHPRRGVRDGRRRGHPARARVRGRVPERRGHLLAVPRVRDLGVRHEHGLDDRDRRRGRLLAVHRQPLPARAARGRDRAGGSRTRARELRDRRRLQRRDRRRLARRPLRHPGGTGSARSRSAPSSSSPSPCSPRRRSCRRSWRSPGPARRAVPAAPAVGHGRGRERRLLAALGRRRDAAPGRLARRRRGARCSSSPRRCSG